MTIAGSRLSKRQINNSHSIADQQERRLRVPLNADGKPWWFVSDRCQRHVPSHFCKKVNVIAFQVLMGSRSGYLPPLLISNECSAIGSSFRQWTISPLRGPRFPPCCAPSPTDRQPTVGSFHFNGPDSITDRQGSIRHVLQRCDGTRVIWAPFRTNGPDSIADRRVLYLAPMLVSDGHSVAHSFFINGLDHRCEGLTPPACHALLLCVGPSPSDRAWAYSKSTI